MFLFRKFLSTETKFLFVDVEWIFLKFIFNVAHISSSHRSHCENRKVGNLVKNCIFTEEQVLYKLYISLDDKLSQRRKMSREKVFYNVCSTLWWQIMGNFAGSGP